jgi:hypothetical protein
MGLAPRDFIRRMNAVKPRSSRFAVSFRSDTTAAQRAMAQSLHRDRMIAILDAFMRDKMVPFLRDDFFASGGPGHPMVFVFGDNGEIQGMREAPGSGGMVIAFDRLLQAFQKVETQSTKAGAVAGLGKRDTVDDMRLDRYMQHGPGGSHSQFNSVLYAVTFGTGIQDNLKNGAAPRTHPLPSKSSKVPGAWWYGYPTDEDLLFAGMEGSGFFYQLRGQNVEPKPHIREFVIRELPPFVASQFRQQQP